MTVQDQPTSREILNAIGGLSTDLNAKHAENTDRMGHLERGLRDLQRAFPDGDADAHRRYHESIIEARELRNKLIRAALMQAAKVGGLGAIGWVAYALWVAFKLELRK